MLVYFPPNCLKYQRAHPGIWLVQLPISKFWAQIVCCARSSNGMCAGQKEDVEDAPEMNFAKFNAANEQTHPLSNDTQP